METYILILISTVFVNNIVLAKILGLCPFMGVSRRLETSISMGLLPSRATMTALVFCLGGALGAALSAAAIGGINPPAEEIVLIEPIQTFEVAATPRLLRLGTGAVTGAYFPVGGALCQIFNARRNADDPLCVALASGGSKDNLEALRAGDIELALVQSDWHFHAQRGSAAFFTAGGLPDLRSLLSVYKEPLTLVARRESGIAKLADLRGKRVSMGPLGSGARVR